MQQLTAVFQSEIFRPVVSLIVPGFYAVSTLFVVGWQRLPEMPTFAHDHPASATLVLFFAVLTCGLIAEDIGSHIEHKLDERLAKCPGYQKHEEQWFEYLRLAFKCEPVGQRYIRSLVLRLKFELGMLVASPFAAAGAIFLQASYAARSVIFGLAAIFFIYFLFEAASSNRALSDVRRELLKKKWDSTDDNAAQT